MSEVVRSFYEGLAEHYHLIFENWQEAIDRHSAILDRLLGGEMPGRSLKILDCACGIGTQALGMAARGHEVVGSDLSEAGVERARREAAKRGLAIRFEVADMTSLAEIADENFDVVMAVDNALPHLTPEEVGLALKSVGSKLKPGGVFLASIRDYDRLLSERPGMQKPVFYGSEEARLIVHQVWDWGEDAAYTLHLYITMRGGGDWTTHHFVSSYRGVPREELSAALASAGFCEIRWMMPAESGFYQPVVLARRPWAK